GAVPQFLTAYPDQVRVLAWSPSDLEEGRREVEPLFLDRPGTSDPSNADPTLEIDEGTDVPAVVRVQMKHVTLEEIQVVVGLQPPIVVDDPFPLLTDLTSD